MPALAHRGRVCTRGIAGVRGFTGARRGVSGNRVRVCGGRRGHTGQGNVRQGNGNGKADDWKWESEDIGDHVDQENFAFAENEGLKLRIKDNSQPVDFAELYLTETIVEVIVRETNRCAESFMKEFPEKADNSFVGQWVPVTMNEMKKFLGLLLLTDFVQKPDFKICWLTEQLLSTPVFSKIMKRDRFLLILKFLYFNNNYDPGFDPNDENRDRLHKIRPFLGLSRERFRKVYQTGKTLSVDESLILFKG